MSETVVTEILKKLSEKRRIEYSDKRRLYQLWSESGLTRVTFCEVNGLSASTVTRWLLQVAHREGYAIKQNGKKRRGVKRQQAVSGGFMPLQLSQSKVASSEAVVLALKLPGAAVLQFSLAPHQLSQFIREISYATAIVS